MGEDRDIPFMVIFGGDEVDEEGNVKTVNLRRIRRIGDTIEDKNGKQGVIEKMDAGKRPVFHVKLPGKGGKGFKIQKLNKKQIVGTVCNGVVVDQIKGLPVGELVAKLKELL